MKPTAIVTGGGKGIGFAIAKQLGLDGYHVAIIARSEEHKYKESLEELKKIGISFLYIQADVSDCSCHQELIDKVVAQFGSIQVLVNNAGIAPTVRRDLLEMTEESFDTVLKVNTKSNMFLTQCVAKQMIKQKEFGKKKGTIVNISSCSADTSSISRGEYWVSKAGIAMLTQLYADRLAQEKIMVYEIRPGVIKTDMTATVQEKYDDMITKGVFPIARWGTPQDVADAVSIFCSDKLLYSTGEIIRVDGGLHIKRL